MFVWHRVAVAAAAVSKIADAARLAKHNSDNAVEFDVLRHENVASSPGVHRPVARNLP